MVYTYDGAGRQLTEQDDDAPAPGSPGVPASASSRAYEPAGHLTRVTDGDGNYTQYTYDGDGNLLTEQAFDRLGNPVEGTSSEAYDAAGRLTRKTDGDSNYTLFTYDGAGRQLTERTYSAAGALLSSSTNTYESAGRLVQRTDGDGNYTLYTYDAAGRQLTEQVYTAPVPPATSGTLVSAHTNQYDPAGNLTRVTDGDGNVTLYSYDAAGNQTGQTVAAGTNQAASTVQLYDQAGNLTLLTDPDNNATHFFYDGAGHKTRMVDPNGNAASYSYDQAGHLTQTLDRDGRKDTYAYDGAGHITQQVWYAANGTVSDTFAFRYDLAGQLVSAANGAGAYSLAYNAVGQVSVVHEPYGAALTMGYDGAGNRTLVVDSLGGSTQSAYDGDGNLTSRILTQSGGPTLSITQGFDQAGRLAHQTRSSDAAGSAVVGSSDYASDGAGKLTTLVHSSAAGSALVSYTLRYDGAGQLTQSTDHGSTTTYTYKATGELTSDGTRSYTYDGAGNRTMAGYQTTLANELASDGTWNYTYDAEGNLTEKVSIATGVVWLYGYNNANQLTAARLWSKDPAGGPTSGAQLELTANYQYDAFGNRVAQDYFETPLATTQVQRYAYDGWNPATPAGSGNENFNVWADLSPTGSLATRYLRGDVVDELFARVDLVSTLGGSTLQPFWYLPDQQGSVRDVLDSSGAIVDTVTYDPYGNILNQANSSKLGRYAWTGRELDPATYLVYNRGRYDDTLTGRWTTQDPTGLGAGDSNLYRYARNSPTNWADPSGLEGEAERRRGPLVNDHQATGGYGTGQGSLLGGGQSLDFGSSTSSRYPPLTELFPPTAPASNQQALMGPPRPSPIDRRPDRDLIMGMVERVRSDWGSEAAQQVRQAIEQELSQADPLTLSPGAQAQSRAVQRQYGAGGDMIGRFQAEDAARAEQQAQWDARLRAMHMGTPADRERSAQALRETGRTILGLIPVIGPAVEAVEQFRRGEIIYGFLMIGLAAADAVPIIRFINTARAAAIPAGVAARAARNARMLGAALTDEQVTAAIRNAPGGLLRSEGSIPLTGVRDFDRLAVGTQTYTRWRAFMERQGITIVERELPQGTRAVYNSATELVLDPRQFRGLDILHESRHFTQIRNAQEAGLSIDFANLNRRRLGITEYDAYRYEMELGRRHGFSQEYIDYLHQRLHDYWGRVQNQVMRSPTAQREFEQLLGRPFDPRRDVIGRPGEPLPP